MSHIIHSHAKPPFWYLALLFIVLLLAVTLATFMGTVDIKPAEIVAVLTGHGDATVNALMMNIRIPRMLTGMLAGIHFAIAGLILQTITRNPLADPSVMGVSQGATLSVTVFLLCTAYAVDPGSNSLVAMPVQWLPVVGMLGGLLAGSIVYIMALRFELGPLRITICGIAIGAVLHAVAIGLIAGWGSERIEVLLEWLSGSLYARSWQHVLFLLPFTVAGLLVLPLLRRPLNLLRFEAPVARSFGLAYRTQFSFALVLACGLAASAVGVSGPIVFVGLVVPHIARALAGRHFTLVLPLTIALGGITVVLGDLIGRLLGHAEEIPIGVITAILGAPVLIVLLRRVP